MRSISLSKLFRYVLLGLAVVMVAACPPVLGNQGDEDYGVTYLANGATTGDPPIDLARYVEGDSVLVKGNTGNLVKPGHTFTGWTPLADTAIPLYHPGDHFDMPPTNARLYAYWMSSSALLTSFSFSGMAADVTISGTTVAVLVPIGTVVTSLVAMFETTGKTVKVNGVLQVSGTTSNDFSAPVDYVVTGADGTAVTYTVTVSTNGNATIGSQVGSIEAGIGGSATYAIQTFYIAESVAPAVIWYSDAAGNIAGDPPVGVTTSFTPVSATTAALTITANPSASAGSYYFAVQYDTVLSPVAAFVVDASSAIPSLAINPVSPWNSSSFSISGTASIASPAALESVEYSTDNGTTWAQAAGGETWFVPMSNLPDGTYTLSFRATGDNGQYTQEQVSFGVDTTPPVVTNFTASDSGTGSPWYFHLNADWYADLTDAGSGVIEYQLSLDTPGPWFPVTSSGGPETGSFGFSAPDGNNALYIQATDAAGNTSVPVSYPIIVDTVGPAITPPIFAANYPVGNTTFNYSLTEATSGISYFHIVMTPGPFDYIGTIGGSITVTFPSAGTYVLNAYAVDGAGNSSPASTSPSITVP